MERANEGWEYIPLVKLGEMLKQMVWFSGDYTLNICKADYESNHKWIPKSASLDIQYRGQQILIKCIWEVRDSQEYPDRFAIGISEPRHPDFQSIRWRVPNRTKYTHSRYYSTTIDRIEDAIHAAQKAIDEDIAAKEEVCKQTKETKATKEKLCKSFDVKITSENTRLFYRENDRYHLNFRALENGLYEINRIGGEYTETEIKKIIGVVGGNPRAIAERLSK